MMNISGEVKEVIARWEEGQKRTQFRVEVREGKDRVAFVYGDSPGDAAAKAARVVLALQS